MDIMVRVKDARKLLSTVSPCAIMVTGMDDCITPLMAAVRIDTSEAIESFKEHTSP